jgi:release factor glutamine methyltransferase
VAGRNARRHAVEDRIRFVRGDLLDAVQGQADVIVSNPPYVPSAVGLAPEIVNYEPAVALYSGTDGLVLLERLIRDARARLADGGLLVVEFGFGQDERVQAMASDSGWHDVEVVADLQGIPRTAVLSR